MAQARMVSLTFLSFSPEIGHKSLLWAVPSLYAYLLIPLYTQFPITSYSLTYHIPSGLPALKILKSVC